MNHRHCHLVESGYRIMETCSWIGSEHVVDCNLKYGLGKAKGNRNKKWNPRVLEMSKPGKPSLDKYVIRFSLLYNLVRKRCSS